MISRKAPLDIFDIIYDENVMFVLFQKKICAKIHVAYHSAKCYTKSNLSYNDSILFLTVSFRFTQLHA